MHIRAISGAAFALLLTAGCGSGGGLGDILGGGGGNTGGSSAAGQIEGTVDQVDSGSRSIVLTNVSNYNSNLQSGGYGSGTTLRVYYDDRTTVSYQGQNYRPTDLERGDRVAVRVSQSGDRYFAEAMQVTYNARAGGSVGGGGNAYGGTIRGTVQYLDTSRRTIQVDRGSGSMMTVQYDNNTWVEYNGRRYTPADLERGDQIELTVQQTSANVYVAQGITVLSSVGSGSGGSGSYNQGSVLRGTVRLLDTSRRLITLEQTSWVSRFNPGTSGNTVTLQYDNNTILEFQGRTAPVTGLERGDVIDVQVRDLGGSNLLAQRITVVRDVNSY